MRLTEVYSENPINHDGAILRKWLRAKSFYIILQKSSIIDVWQGSKYASTKCLATLLEVKDLQGLDTCLLEKKSFENGNTVLF